MTTNSKKTKSQIVIDLLKRDKGASLAEIGKATNWRKHSIRGFLSGTVKKRMGFGLTCEKDVGGVRRYRIEADA